MKLTPLFLFTGFLFVASVATTMAAVEFPELRNTNTAEGGVGEPPMTAEEALATMELPPGFTASVFAAEPDIQNPIQLTWDTHGRLWVAENYTMERDRFTDEFRDRIVILDNADGGTSFANRSIFYDQFQNLMGFAIGYGGVWIQASPNILFVPDRDADGVPDGPPEVVYDGFSHTGGNMHTSANGLEFGIDGWIYGRTGHAHVQLIGPPGTPISQRTRLHGSIFRFHPVTRVFEALSSGTVNPFGQDWDKYGEHFFDSTIVGHFWYMIPGAKWVSSSAEPNLKAYELIDHIADHRFGRRSGGGRGAGIVTPAEEMPENGYANGHSVVGMMIYQGDSWPESYRDRAYFLNLFGHRMNVEVMERNGSGFIGRRPEEPDIFDMSDPWYRGIDLSYGPDGSVFVTDWSDTGDYHNRSGENRFSGRIYKITYGEAAPSFGSDLTGLSIEELVALNTHRNEWFPRQARVELSNRMVNGIDLSNARELLREQFESDPDVVNKLRALWTLHMLGGTDEELLLPLLSSSEEPLRAWGIRLLANHWPIDALHTDDPDPSRASLYIQQRPAPVVGGAEVDPSEPVLAQFARMAATDPSSLIRLILASTLQRLPFEDRPPIAAGLVSHAEDAEDKNLPLVTWYGLIPLAETDPQALAQIATQSELRATRKYITRRLAEDMQSSQEPVNRIIQAAINESEAYQSDIVDGLAQGLEGQQDLELPMAWDAFSDQIHETGSAELVAKVSSLDVLLGSARAIAAARTTALDADAAPDARRDALRSLMNARVPDLRELAVSLLEVSPANAVAASALATFNDPSLAPVLVASYPHFEAQDRPQLISALASRPSFARVLLDSIAEGRIPRSAISASDARQIRNLGDETLATRLAEVWGVVRETPEEKLELLETYRTELTVAQGGLRSGRIGRGDGGGRAGRGNRGGSGRRGGQAPDPVELADLSQGRLIFSQVCAVCHTLYGEGGSVGPDLTGGARRHDLDALLEKLVNPSSELPADSRYTFLELRDGRTLAGIIVNRTANTVTLQSVTDSLSIPLTEILSTETANYSIMPEGLLEALDATQRRDLIAYLMSDEQVPLPPTPNP